MLFVIPDSIRLNIPEKYLTDVRAIEQNKFRRGRQICLRDLTISHLKKQLEQVKKEAILITPNVCFVARSYSSSISTSLYSHENIHAATLNCYGNAASYLVQGLISFTRQYQPSVEQIKLFIDKLNDDTQSFMLCKRTPELDGENAVSPFWYLYWGFTQNYVPYKAGPSSWELTQMPMIRQTITASKSTDWQIWLNSYDGKRLTRQAITHLKKWKVQKESIIYKKADYFNQSLSEQCVLVTISPNKKKIKEIGEWAIKYA